MLMVEENRISLCFAFSTEQIGIFSHQFHHFRPVKLPDTYIGNITDDAHGIFHTFKEVLQFCSSLLCSSSLYLTGEAAYAFSMSQGKRT